jgi:hypothetical protein
MQFTLGILCGVILGAVVATAWSVSATDLLDQYLTEQRLRQERDRYLDLREAEFERRLKAEDHSRRTGPSHERIPPMSDLSPKAAVLTAVFCNSAPTAPQAASASSAPPVPTVPPVVEPHSHAGLSPTEAETMAGWIKDNLAKGRMTSAQAQQAFNQLGTPPEARVTMDGKRTDGQKLIDAHFPAAKPEDYQIRYSDPGQSPPLMSTEMKIFDQSARIWLSGAEFPRELGNSLVSAIERTAQTTKAMNADELESYGHAEYQKLERAYGSELESKLQAAGRMVDALDNKQLGLKNLLRSKGIGDNVLVVAQIIGQAERWHACRKGR